MRLRVSARIHHRSACAGAGLPGPGNLLRWSVPAVRGHNDLLISAALTARLVRVDWQERVAQGEQ